MYASLLYSLPEPLLHADLPSSPQSQNHTGDTPPCLVALALGTSPHCPVSRQLQLQLQPSQPSQAYACLTLSYLSHARDEQEHEDG